jgi:hypothetical protein
MTTRREPLRPAELLGTTATVRPSTSIWTWSGWAAMLWYHAGFPAEKEDPAASYS